MVAGKIPACVALWFTPPPHWWSHSGNQWQRGGIRPNYWYRYLVGTSSSSLYLPAIHFSSRLSVNFLTSGFQHLLTKVLHTYLGVNGDQTPSTPPSSSLMPDAHPCPSLPKVYCKMKKDGENYLDIADSWPCGFSSVPHSGQRVILFHWDWSQQQLIWLSDVEYGRKSVVTHLVTIRCCENHVLIDFHSINSWKIDILWTTWQVEKHLLVITATSHCNNNRWRSLTELQWFCRGILPVKGEFFLLTVAKCSLIGGHLIVGVFSGLL